MKPHTKEILNEAETLKRGVKELERLVATLEGKCSYEAHRSLRDALSSLRRCQDYFKGDDEETAL